MDDKDKGIIQKTIEAVEEFASEVKDAAKHMMEPPEPLKPGDEVVMLPMTDNGLFGPPPTPQFMVIHHPRTSRAKTKKTAKKAAKKTATNPAKRKTVKKPRKAKSAVKKEAAKKVAKKKKAKKSRR